MDRRTQMIMILGRNSLPLKPAVVDADLVVQMIVWMLTLAQLAMKGDPDPRLEAPVAPPPSSHVAEPMK